MSANLTTNLFFTALLVFMGLYCMLVSRNLLRLLIGVEIVSKGVLLALVTAGQAVDKLGTAQGLAITMIVVEVVVIAVALGLVVRAYSAHGTLDVWKLNTLRG
ncbi:MAG: NADH-quinone oxidoreductase subunit K [Elusimicrobiota bacterium]